MSWDHCWLNTTGVSSKRLIMVFVGRHRTYETFSGRHILTGDFTTVTGDKHHSNCAILFWELSIKTKYWFSTIETLNVIQKYSCVLSDPIHDISTKKVLRTWLLQSVSVSVFVGTNGFRWDINFTRCTSTSVWRGPTVDESRERWPSTLHYRLLRV